MDPDICANCLMQAGSRPLLQALCSTHPTLLTIPPQNFSCALGQSVLYIGNIGSINTNIKETFIQQISLGCICTRYEQGDKVKQADTILSVRLLRWVATCPAVLGTQGFLSMRASGLTLTLGKLNNWCPPPFFFLEPSKTKPLQKPWL